MTKRHDGNMNESGRRRGGGGGVDSQVIKKKNGVLVGDSKDPVLWRWLDFFFQSKEVPIQKQHINGICTLFVDSL